MARVLSSVHHCGARHSTALWALTLHRREGLWRGTVLCVVATPSANESAHTVPAAKVSGQRIELRRWLGGIASIAAAVNTLASRTELLELVSRTACELMDYKFCAVTLADPDRGALVIEGSSGLSAEYIAGVNAEHPITLRPGDPDEAPSSRAFTTRRPVHVSDISVAPTFRPWETVARLVAGSKKGVGDVDPAL